MKEKLQGRRNPIAYPRFENGISCPQFSLQYSCVLQFSFSDDGHDHEEALSVYLAPALPQF